MLKIFFSKVRVNFFSEKIFQGFGKKFFFGNKKFSEKNFPPPEKKFRNRDRVMDRVRK